MHKKFEVNQTKIKGDCQLYTNAAPQELFDTTIKLNSTSVVAQCAGLVAT